MLPLPEGEGRGEGERGVRSYVASPFFTGVSLQ